MNLKASQVVHPTLVAAALTELWSPRIIGEVDDVYVKVAKVQGEFTWHTHDDEDELFFVLEGTLQIAMEDETIVLQKGETFVVKKGTRHRPFAERECLILLLEKKSTQHTGHEVTPLTRSITEQIG